MEQGGAKYEARCDKCGKQQLLYEEERSGVKQSSSGQSAAERSRWRQEWGQRRWGQGQQGYTAQRLKLVDDR